jgi:hypothetical protein
MSKIVITKEQYQRLFETGAANAAMDLDIYVQPVNYDTSTGNENMEDSIEEIIDNLKELNSLFKVGKKIKSSTKNKIFQAVDVLKNVYDSAKEKP